MKAQKFSEEIVRVSYLPELYQLLGMNRDGLVTLLNIEDGSILYPHLLGNKFSEFNKHFFYFEDKNYLPFLVEASTGEIVTLDNFSDLVEENCDLNIEEKAEIREFYKKFWRPLNNEYYIFCYTNFLSLVKKDTLEPKFKKYSIIDPIEQTPFILVGNNENELRLYRIKSDKEIEAIFDDSNLYVSKEDIFKLKNGRFLINVKNEEVYIV